LDLVGSSFKERVIEFFLNLSGILFYQVILRPIEYWKSRKKEKAQANITKKEVT